MPRWMIRVVKVAVVVFVVFHVAAGWYFATLIRSDALEVKPFEDPVFAVVSAGDGLITLDGGEADTVDLLRDDTLGIDFGSGYGRVGRITEVKDEVVVTRTYEHLWGAEPEPGLEATLHGEAYTDVSGVADLPMWEEVTYESEFGTFPAWLVDLHSTTWAITVHGRGASRSEGLRMLPTLTRAGLTTMLISYRNDAGAPATSDHLARFGETEWQDLEGAVRYALDHGAEDVILVGYSMGGAVSLAFLERSPLSAHVVATILEAPALDLSGMVTARAADTDVIPGVPWKVPVTLTVTARAWADLLYDVDWWMLDYLHRPQIVQVPTLLIHGDADSSVPVEQSITFAARVGSLATLEVFPGAEHVRSWNVDRARYEAAVERFLSDVGATAA